MLVGADVRYSRAKHIKQSIDLTAVACRLAVQKGPDSLYMMLKKPGPASILDEDTELVIGIADRCFRDLKHRRSECRRAGRQELGSRPCSLNRDLAIEVFHLSGEEKEVALVGIFVGQF